MISGFRMDVTELDAVISTVATCSVLEWVFQDRPEHQANRVLTDRQSQVWQLIYIQM